MKSLLRRLWLPALVLVLASTALAGEPAPTTAALKKSKTTAAASRRARSARKPRRQETERQKEEHERMEREQMDRDMSGPSQLLLQPVPPTTGVNGLFTVESGEPLPRKTIATMVGVNKFSRAPGSLTVLNTSMGVAVQVSKRWSLFVNFDPNRHVHLGRPTQLSVNPVSLGCPQVGNTIYRSISCTVGGAAAYVEDYPFVNRSGNGVGEFVVGAKFNILSQRRGNPFGLSLRGDIYIPTAMGLGSLLDRQNQSGQVNFGVTAAATRNFGGIMEGTLNAGVRLTRNPHDGSTDLMVQANQFKVGLGMLMFPRSRFQIMSEYNGTIFFGDSTPNTTFGPRDPVDGVWGLRLYPWKQVAVDLGYRYMLNLNGTHDRHGFVVKIGTSWTPAPPPPPPVLPPSATCSVDKSSIYIGSGDAVNLNVNANDPAGYPLTYSYTVTGGTVEGNGPQARWNLDALGAGNYTVTAQVDNGHGGVVSCSADARVEPKPNHPPVMTCSVERSSAIAGERVRVTANASDPDNDPLTYTWRSNGGQVVGSGASVELDTTGLAPGSYTVTGRVEDGKGGAADCTADVKVEAPAPAPQSSKLNECSFRSGSARVDNVCKRVLDDVALRLSSTPRDRIVIVGYADPKEAKSEKLAKQRADNASKYLQDKGAAVARIETRAAGGQKGADKQNRRLDVILVPEGATY
jgi:outer membrane protein OmpA-like peptidoglycan-associated protein